MAQTARAPTTPAQPVDNAWFVEVVELARTGDKAAFDRLYQHFYVPISKYLAHMVGDDEEGNDLAQETFLKAWQSLSGIRDGLRFHSWLYRIATNTALDHLRRRKFRCSRWESSGEDGLPAKMYVSGPEEHVAEMEHIQQALAHVSLKYRSCLILQLVVNLSQREIAASLKISEKSVSIYVSRGSEQFRLAYQHLLQSNHKLARKEGMQIHEKRNERFNALALYRLGAEALGQAPG
ncbi:MAG TPA: RNA polymerase sigma factor [Ktedonobacteraceae bacterium]|nr:RNA polymerase sigma factor [Ktedonobacteraceae bacterium]